MKEEAVNRQNLKAIHMDTAMRIQSGFIVHMNPNWNPMRIKCALHSIHFGRWFGSRLKLDSVIIHDLRKVTPTMRSLAWLFVACGACYIASFCSALAATLGKKEGCFLKAEKSGAAR